MEKQPGENDSDLRQFSPKSVPSSPRVDIFRAEAGKNEENNINIWKKIVPSEKSRTQADSPEKNVPDAVSPRGKQRPPVRKIASSGPTNNRALKRRSSFGGSIGEYRNADQPPTQKSPVRKRSKPISATKHRSSKPEDRTRSSTNAPQVAITSTSPIRKPSGLGRSRRRSNEAAAHVNCLSTLPTSPRADAEIKVGSPRPPVTFFVPDAANLETSEEYSMEMRSNGKFILLFGSI